MICVVQGVFNFGCMCDKAEDFIGGTQCNMILHTHDGFLGSSVSLSGGDQVDGLPPAPSACTCERIISCMRVCVHVYICACFGAI